MTRRRLIQALVIFGFVVGSPGVAEAKVTATPGYSYISGNADCAWTQAWLTDEGNSPGLWSVGTSDYFNGNTCGDNTFVSQTNRLAVIQNLLRWNGASWARCPTNAAWVYNHDGPSHEVWTGFGWAAPPCGPGIYRSLSQAASQTNFGSVFHSHSAILGNDWVIIN